MNTEEMMTITEACKVLGIDKHNAFKLMKRCVLTDAGVHKVIGSVYQRYVTTKSVLDYQKRQRILSQEVETFKMRMSTDLYIAVCKGTMDEEQMLDLRRVFLAATNLTIQGRTYRKLRGGGVVDLKDEFDDDFDDDTSETLVKGEEEDDDEEEDEDEDLPEVKDVDVEDDDFDEEE